MQVLNGKKLENRRKVIPSSFIRKEVTNMVIKIDVANPPLVWEKLNLKGFSPVLHTGSCGKQCLLIVGTKPFVYATLQAMLACK